MSKQTVNIGSAPNDGTGDSIRVGMNKINLNFSEIYNAIGNGTNVSDISVINASASGGGSLSYSNRVLTFTPPELSSYLTGIGTISQHTDVQVSNPQVGQVLKWNGTNWINDTDATGGGGGGGITYSNLSVTYGSASGVGTLTYNNTNGTFTFAPADFSGYLTGIGTISQHTDVEVSNPQIGEVLKWNGTNWVNGSDSVGTGGGGGIAGINVRDNTTVIGTDITTIDFGANLSATLSSGIVTVNATDTNTTYSQSAVVSGNNVNLRLSGSDSVNDDILVTAGTNVSFTNVTAAGFTVNSSVSRTTAAQTTSSIGVGNADNISITAAKTYVLYSIQTNYPAWVTLYTDSASRTADASRLETQDPLPGSGVVAEVITTSGNLTQLITPGTIGFNNDGTPSTTVYAKVVNKHSSSVAITVTLKYLKLED